VRRGSCVGREWGGWGVEAEGNGEEEWGECYGCGGLVCMSWSFENSAMCVVGRHPLQQFSSL
jgi:hypothetical protein